jgi:hypothetical protein
MDAYSGEGGGRERGMDACSGEGGGRERGRDGRMLR